MRILLVSHGLPPDSVGGVEQHVSGLAAALVAQGHEVDIFARGNLPGAPQGSFEQTVDSNPRVWRTAYRWENVDSLDAMYLCTPMADAMERFLAERQGEGVRYDVAHIHHLTGMSVESLQRLRDAGVPIVMTLHDYWLLSPCGQLFYQEGPLDQRVQPDQTKACLTRLFPGWMQKDPDATVARLHERTRTTLALPKRLIVPSARAIPAFEGIGVARDRFTVVENGVDTDSLKKLPAPSGGPGPLRIGYFGTLMPSKGLDVLIAAVQALPPGMVELHIHGNTVPYHGDETYLTKCFMQLQPGSGVTYYGPYSLEEMPDRMATIDVLAAPALWHEVFGLTVREALAAARPVLVSQIGGLQDAIEDGMQGRILPPGDVNSWAAAIRELAEDRALLQRFIANSRVRARGFDAMAHDLSIIYSEAAEGPGRS
jgi:glycosyltransferase involved in cell wall biosynthesis